MKPFKCLISFLLSIVLSILCMEYFPINVTNTIEEDICAYAETEQTNNNHTITIDEDISKYAQEVRKYLKQHSENFTISIDIDVTEKNYDESDLANAVFLYALQHTGINNEGDYLYCSINQNYVDAYQKVVDDKVVTIAYYTIDYKTTLEQENTLDNYADKIISNLDLKEDTDYEKIFKIYNYICQTVHYDYAGLDDDTNLLEHTAYSAICQQKAVCDGYAQALYKLFLKVGIDNRIVIGTLYGVPHAWNIVKLDDMYYVLDATADAEKLEYEYFLKNYDCDSFTNYHPGNNYLTDDFCLKYPIADNEYASTIQASKNTYNNFEYIASIDSITITSYTGNDEYVLVPSKINDIPVKRIARDTFLNNDYIKVVEFENGIEELSSLSINNCTNLEKIIIPSTMQLSSLTSSSFCTGLNGIVDFCPNLKEYEVATDNPYMKTVDGILYNSEMTILLSCPASIGLEKLVVPNSVISINDSAFEYNNTIKEIVLPNCIQYIGHWAFNDASLLEKVNIPEDCNIIGQFAFNGTAIKKFYIPADFTGSIMDCAFDSSMVEDIEIDPSNKVFSLVNNCFIYKYNDGYKMLLYVSQENQQEVIIPNIVTDIAMQPFSRYITIEKLVLGDGITNCTMRSFWYANINKIIIPNSVTSIEQESFSCTNWEDISETSIRYLELYIPSTVENIDDNAIIDSEPYIVIIHGEVDSTAETFANNNGYVFISNDVETVDEIQVNILTKEDLDISNLYNIDDYEWMLSDSNICKFQNGIITGIYTGNTLLIGYNDKEYIKIKINIKLSDFTVDLPKTELELNESIDFYLDVNEVWISNIGTDVIYIQPFGDGKYTLTGTSVGTTTIRFDNIYGQHYEVEINVIESTTVTTTPTTNDDITTDTKPSNDYIKMLSLKKYLLGITSTVDSQLDLNNDANINVLDFMQFKNQVLKC